MSETNIIKYRIQFLSGHEGLGWMEVEQTNMTIYRIIKDDGNDVTNDGMSYRTINE